MAFGSRDRRAPAAGAGRWRSRVALLVTVFGVVGLLPACRALVLVRTTPVITATAEPSHFIAGSALTLTVVVSPDVPGGPTPTGQLSIPQFNTTLQLVDGRFTWSGAFNPSGTFVIPFDYSGDSRYLPGSGSLEFTADLGMVPFTGSGATVAMAGDSITFLAKPSIEDRLSTAGYRHSVTGVPGTTTVGAQWLVDDYAATRPDVVIFDLGTNDLSNLALGEAGATVEALEARVAGAAAQFPNACFVVTTVSAHRTAAWQPPYATYNAAADAYNSWVRATFPHVVDWEAAVATSLATGTSILTDEVHPTNAGQSVLADLTRQAADQCLGRV